MKRFLKENSLSLVLIVLFAVFITGQSITGYLNHNEELESHEYATISYPEYLTTGAFIEATFENWESEFLQMGAYVLLTVWLRQKGSAESRKLVGEEAIDAGTRASGLGPWAYRNSLSLAFFLLFFMSFALHAYGGAHEASLENIQHGEQGVSTLEYVTTSQFWFESFQNWQSEFLAVFAIVVLSIFLRQQGSPQSKPISASNAETGSA
jgi:hypothetical protein